MILLKANNIKFSIKLKQLLQHITQNKTLKNCLK
jgi:hypothetical protein